MNLGNLLSGTPTLIPLREDTRVHLHLPMFVVERNAGTHTMRAQLTLDEALDQLDEFPHMECLGRAWKWFWWTDHKSFNWSGHEVKPVSLGFH